MRFQMNCLAVKAACRYCPCPCQSSKILLCDEATSALDPQTTKSVLQLLKKINEEQGITIVMVTHEMDVIETVCDYVAVMEKGDVIETGSTLQIFSQPQHPTTKTLSRRCSSKTCP